DGVWRFCRGADGGPLARPRSLEGGGCAHSRDDRSGRKTGEATVMNWLEQLAPGPYFLWLALEVIAQVTGVTLVAALFAATVLKRSAAARHRLWLCSLACILVSPVVAIALDRTGITLEVIPWGASSASAEDISVEPEADLVWEPSTNRFSSP